MPILSVFRYHSQETLAPPCGPGKLPFASIIDFQIGLRCLKQGAGVFIIFTGPTSRCSGISSVNIHSESVILDDYKDQLKHVVYSFLKLFGV